MTKTDLTTKANRHLRFGRYTVSTLQSYVTCPDCREEVHGFMTAAELIGPSGRKRSWTPVLRKALVSHLAEDCGRD